MPVVDRCMDGRPDRTEFIGPLSVLPGVQTDCGFDEAFNMFDEIDNNHNKLHEYKPTIMFIIF